jgi:hypothetical protein
MAEYIRFKFDTKKLKLKTPVIRIYPLVCFHIGAEQSDGKFINQMITRLKNDPNGRGIYMGDGGECVIRSSVGNIYEQLLSPQGQHDRLVELFEPVKEKLLFGIRGNHGNRIYKETGLEFDKNLCHRIGIPYMGVAAFVNLVVNRSSYDLYVHHGIDSGVSATTKIRKAEQLGNNAEVDATLTAHSHYCIELPPLYKQNCDNTNARIVTRVQSQYICGSAYDSRTGYAEEKGYSPLLPSHIIITFDGRIISGKAVKQQRSEIVRSTADYEIVPA